MADTMHAIIEAHRSALAACENERDPKAPLNMAEREAWAAFVSAPCTTPDHVLAKVAYVTDSERLTGWIADDQHDPATFLVSLRLPAAPADPLLAVVNAYSDGLATFNASSFNLSPDEDQALQAVTWEPHYDALRAGPPAATTLAGAIAAVRLVLREEETCGHDEAFTTNTLRAALAYFDGRA